MSTRRLALAAVVVLPLALAGCTKPAPGATVFSGTTSVHAEAACWSFDEAPIDPTACAQKLMEDAASGAQLNSLPVIPGTVVGISVEPQVADVGWIPRIGSQQLVAEPLTTTYWRFTFPDFQEFTDEGLALEIIAGNDEGTRGVWIYQLVPGSA